MNTLEPAAQSKPPGGFKLWLSQLQMKHGRKLVIALPYIWLILLFLLPFLLGHQSERTGGGTALSGRGLSL